MARESDTSNIGMAMRRIFYFLAVAVALCSCTDKSKIRGHYHSVYGQTIHDGVECDVFLDADENFGFWSFDNDVKMKLTFKFGDLEFPDLSLNYKVGIEGEWDYRDGKLIVEADSATFRHEYVDSSAKNATERTMVLQLRNNVVKTELIPLIRKKLMEISERSVKVYELSDNGLVVEEPLNGGKLVMKRVE